MLYFLINLTLYLGFYPLVSKNHEYFNPTDGVFDPMSTTESFTLQESQLIKRLLILNDFSISHFSQNERQILLKSLVIFYSLHVHGFEHLKSLDVLHEMYR